MRRSSRRRWASSLSWGNSGLKGFITHTLLFLLASSKVVGAGGEPPTGGAMEGAAGGGAAWWELRRAEAAVADGLEGARGAGELVGAAAGAEDREGLAEVLADGGGGGGGGRVVGDDDGEIEGIA